MMFQIAKQFSGDQGSFVKLVHLDSEDFAVILRSASDGKLHHLYIGPDQHKAEEVFEGAVQNVASKEQLQ